MIFIKNKFLKTLYTFITNWEVILFCLLITSGIDLGAYFLQVMLFIIVFNKLTFDKKLLNSTFLILCLLLLIFILTFNLIALKYIGLICFNFILYNASKYLFSKNYNIKSIVDFVFILHVIVILLSFFIPPLNKMLSLGTKESIRYAGLIRGYDFVPFVCGTYIICEFRYIKYKIDFVFGLKLALSLIVTLLSGRFGLVVFSFIFMYILFSKFTLAKFFSLFLIISLGLIVFNERLQFTYTTIINILDFSVNNDIEVFTQLDGENVGFYAGSPITWFDEFKKPFAEPFKYLWPQNIVTVVDTGVSYIFSNLGFLCGLGLYIYSLNFFKVNNKIFYTMFFLFLIIDIKFRSVFVVLPMFWLYLNLYKIEYKENLDNKISII